MYSKTGKCPYHHNEGTVTIISNDSSHALIRYYVGQFNSGLMKSLSIGEENFEEKQQALFAYRISQLAKDTNFFNLLEEYMNIMIESPDSYRAYTNEIKWHLQGMWEKLFRSMEIDNTVVSRLTAWLDTFHAFLKRVVITSYAKWERNFPYRLGIQFASTSLERANILAQDPDIQGWQGLFFDPSYDISSMYLGIPTTRPVYNCPVLYSWEFRSLIDHYYSILCVLWENSKDKPKALEYFLNR
jgi:hypothetical protein